MIENPIKCSEKVAMVFTGMINNIFFLIVMSSAQRIVAHYDASGLLGVVDWSCTFCGLFAGYINTMLSTCNFSYDLRFGINATLMLVGLIGCAYSPTFWMACICILFVGFSCNFGESVTLGYLAYIKKSSLVKFWGIGTGAAGILGSGFSVLVLAIDFSYKYSFLCLLPFVIVYAICYFLVLRQKPESKEDRDKQSINTAPLMSEGADYTQSKDEDSEKAKCCSLDFFKRILYYIVTCDIVYFAQYVIATAFLDCAQTQEYHDTHKYFFPLLSLVQHCGVLIFCSTLTFFEFPYLGSMAVFQMINFVIWLTQATFHWMPIWSEFCFIFLVGSCGGLSYANTYNLILKDDSLNHKEKELGTNVTAFTVTISVLLSSVFTLVSEKTFLKQFVPQ